MGELLSALCPTINPLQCAVAESSCASLVGGLGSMMDPSSLMSMEPACTHHGFKLEPDSDIDFTTTSASADFDATTANADFAVTSASTTMALWLGCVSVASSVVFGLR